MVHSVASTKVSGLKASIDAALGRIFEIDGQNAEEEARWKTPLEVMAMVSGRFLKNDLELVTNSIIMILGLVIVTEAILMILVSCLAFSSKNHIHLAFLKIKDNLSLRFSFCFRDPGSPHSGTPLLAEVQFSFKISSILADLPLRYILVCHLHINFVTSWYCNNFRPSLRTRSSSRSLGSWTNELSSTSAASGTRWDMMAITINGQDTYI